MLVGEDGTLNVARLRSLASQIAGLNNCGVIVVTSGAVAAGWAKLGLAGKPADLALKQASAAAGQSALMRHYEEHFGRHNRRVAQVLLTRGDLLGRSRQASLSKVLSVLLERGVIPIINENDAVSSEGLAPLAESCDAWMNFSDNDTLAAAIACELKADLLVLLTNVDGVFDRYPLDEGSKLIRRVGRGECIEHLANGASTNGRGGMLSKIRAARKAAENGVTVAIANGNREGIIGEVVSGRARCTVFEPQGFLLPLR